MIELIDIHRSYGSVTRGHDSRVEVLKGVSLEIEPHRMTTIVGPSGAGKSTLLQILGTLDRADSGRVVYNGVDVTRLKDKELSRFRNLNIGFIFQAHRLLPEFTIEENVAMPALIGGVSRRQAMEHARQLLTNVGLSHRLDHRPAQLSGGECQRAAVARALINTPSVILADEPTGSLDSANRRELQRIFADLRDTMGTTFVIVTHDSSLADSADCVVSLSDGAIGSITYSHSISNDLPIENQSSTQDTTHNDNQD